MAKILVCKYLVIWCSHISNIFSDQTICVIYFNDAMTKYCIRTLECYTHSMYYSSTQFIHSSEIRNVRLCEVLSIVQRIASNCNRKLKTDQSTLGFRMLYKIWQILTINLISLPEFLMSAAYVLSVTTVFNEISPQLIRKFVRALFFL